MYKQIVIVIVIIIIIIANTSDSVDWAMPLLGNLIVSKHPRYIYLTVN